MRLLKKKLRERFGALQSGQLDCTYQAYPVGRLCSSLASPETVNKSFNLKRTPAMNRTEKKAILIMLVYIALASAVLALIFGVLLI